MSAVFLIQRFALFELRFCNNLLFADTVHESKDCMKREWFGRRSLVTIGSWNDLIDEIKSKQGLLKDEAVTKVRSFSIQQVLVYLLN